MLRTRHIARNCTKPPDVCLQAFKCKRIALISFYQYYQGGSPFWWQSNEDPILRCSLPFALGRRCGLTGCEDMSPIVLPAALFPCDMIPAGDWPADQNKRGQGRSAGR